MTRRLTPFLALFFLCISVFNEQLHAQSLSCNGHTNISANATCSTTITPAMVTTSAPVGSTVTVMNGTNVIPQPLTSAILNLVLTVKVTDLTGNACWGTIKVEDKAAPTLACAASPQNVNCAIQNLSISETPRIIFDNIPNNNIADVNITGIFGAPVVTENCGLYTLSYSDVVDDKDCTAAGISAVVSRTWVAIDAQGNSSNCTIVYNMQRQLIASVTLPVDVTLSCSGTFAKEANGNPAVSVTGSPKINGVNIYPTIAGFCEMGASFQDTKVGACGNTYKVIRKWSIIDQCNSAVLVHKQVIFVLDKIAPTFSNCVTTDLILPVNGNNCDLDDYTVPSLVATDDCTALPVITSVLTEGGIQKAVGPIFNNVTLGNYILTYTATDACGNTATCSRNLLLSDITAPVAVCDLNTKVALTSDGSGTLLATSVDNGSLDNCCFNPNRFEIKRASAPDSDYKPELKVNCADKNLMVALRVWDCFNNSNVCMVNVLVEDKLPPVITAKDTAVICGNNTAAETWLNINKPLKKTNLSDLPTANNPGWYDNCDADVAFIDSKNIDNCGKGTYTRTWTVTDKSVLKLTATTVQKYVSANRSAFKVTFPKDTLFNSLASCPKTETTPDQTGRPVIETIGATCPLVGVEYIDEEFNIADGNSCYKIVRTWKIMNWCNFNPNDAIQIVPSNSNGAVVTVTMNDKGYLEYKQIIKVVDNTPPTVVFKSYTLLPVGKECKAELTIPQPEITDACSNQSNKSYTILDSDNKIFAQSTTFPGKYTFTVADFGKKFIIRYFASDKCGNATSTDQSVTIKDVTKPTPICHHGLTVEIMQTKMVMIDAKLFDAGSYDNCTTQGKLKFKIQYPATPPGTVVNPNLLPDVQTFSCADSAIIPMNDQLGFLANVGLWVCDEAGNADYCETYIIVQDNNMVCDYKPIQMKTLAGAIVTEKNSEVEAVQMNMEGSTKQSELSNISGKFAFKNISPQGKYTITPEKLENPMNGVSTLDLVLMSKHILGTQPLATPYQWIAADVNKSGTVSTADIVELRKMILGLQTAFSKNNSWRFVDKAYAFDATISPLKQTFKEDKIIEITNYNSPLDFVGVKIGDINGNASTKSGNASGRGANGTTSIELEDKTLQNGDVFKINMTTPSDIEAYQTTFEFDKNNIELLDIQGAESNYAVIENGKITISTEKENPIQLTFKAKNNVQLSKSIRLTDAITANEAYNTQAETFVLGFNFGEKTTATAFELFQNRPNPFREETIISFNLPQSGNATLSVCDVTGKVVKTIDQTFEKGYNEVKINKNNLNATGVYYIKLEQNGLTTTKKMLSVE